MEIIGACAVVSVSHGSLDRVLFVLQTLHDETVAATAVPMRINSHSI